MDMASGCSYHDRDSALNTNVMQLSDQITTVLLLLTLLTQKERPVGTLGERVSSVREERGLSQASLAQKAGVSQGTIGNIESGARKRPRDLVAIAKALDVSADWLETGKGSPDIIMIDGAHRLFGALKDLDLDKVMLESLNVDAFVESRAALETSQQDEEEAELIKSFRKLPRSERTAFAEKIRARSAEIQELVERYLQEKNEAVDVPILARLGDPYAPSNFLKKAEKPPVINKKRGEK